MKKQYLEAGRIVNTHGVRGEVKIEPWADDAAFLTRFRRFYLDGKPVAVRSCRVHKSMCIALLEGVDDVNAAMPLKGKVIFIDRDDAKLPKGTVSPRCPSVCWRRSCPRLPRRFLSSAASGRSSSPTCPRSSSTRTRKTAS